MNKSFLRRLSKFYDSVESPAPYKTKTVAFLIYKNKIIEFGVNSAKTSPYQNYWRRRARVESNDEKIFYYDMPHAEIACVKKLRGFTDWQHTKLVVISKCKDGSYRTARPCKICLTMIKAFGIKEIWYSCPDGFRKETYGA